MLFDVKRIRQNAHEADTEDLLDRVTVFRQGMEPAALDLIETELRRRGVTLAQIDDHSAQRQALVLWLPDGTAARCSFCERPAVADARTWHLVFGLIPLFPYRCYYCDLHQPEAEPPATSDGSDEPGPLE